MTAILSTTTPGARLVGPAGADRFAAATPVDHTLVAEIRHEVSDALALRLREAPVNDPRARRELARSLVAEVLAGRAEPGCALAWPRSRLRRSSAWPMP